MRSEAAPADAEVLEAPAVPPDKHIADDDPTRHLLGPGTLVRIVGLKSRVELNGKTGVVTDVWNGDRCPVKIEVEDGKHQVLLCAQSCDSNSRRPARNFLCRLVHPKNFFIPICTG